MPDLEGYFSRVDAELAKLTPAEGQDFLERLSNQWERQYGDFQARIARGAPTPAGVTAFDYIETIAGLDQRATPLTPTAEALADVRQWQRSRAGA